MKDYDEPADDRVSEYSVVPDRIGESEKPKGDVKPGQAGPAAGEEKEPLRETAERPEVVFWIQDADLSDTVYVSPSYERVWGESCAGLYYDPRSWMKNIHPLDVERVKGAVSQGGDTGQVLEYRIIRPDRAVRRIRHREFPVRKRDGYTDRIAVTAEDITEATSADEALRENEKRLRLTVWAITYGVWDWDITTGKVIFSPGYYTMLGYEPYEFPQDYDSFRGLLHPDDIDRAERELEEHIERGEGYAMETRMRTKSGDWMWIMTRGKVVGHDAHGRALRIIGTHADVTTLMRAKARAEESERQYRTALESSPDGVALIRGSEAFWVNRRFPQMFGYESREEILKAGSRASVHPDDLSTLHEYARRRQGGKDSVPLRYDFRGIKKDGTTILVEASAVGTHWAGEPVSLVHLRDITESRKAEEELKRREEDLRRKSIDLEETNIALKVLLRHRDDDRAGLENTIRTNVKDTVFPYIEKLRGTHLSDAQETYVAVIESGLNEIVSPFLQKMSALSSRFTRTEIQVANLIKSGKSTKEIAELLNVSTGTVETHRNNIRSKLGLKHKNLNLQAHLLSL